MKNARHFIRSLEKGFTLLSMFSPEKPGLSLAELTALSGMNAGTTYRYLYTLTRLGYLAQDSQTRTYRLTPKVLTFGFSALRSMDLRSRLLPYMVETTKELNVTTICAILEGTEIVFIERLRSANFVNLDLTVGSRLPAYCTAMGKAILAFMDKKETRTLIRQMNFVSYTPYTIPDAETLWRELELTKKRGYAINNQELTVGLRTLAVPIFKESREVEAAFGLSFPCHRVEGNKLQTTFVERLIEVSRTASIEY